MFDALEVMSRPERGEYISRKLQQQIQYAYENAPAMRAKLDKAGVRPSDIRTVKDLEKLPVARKDELIILQKANPPFGGLLGVPQQELTKFFMQPGPIYIPFHLGDSYFRRIERGLYSTGFRKGDLVVNTWSYHMMAAGPNLEEALRRLGCTVIPMGVGNTEQQVQVLADTKATGWVGMASFLMTILSRAEEMGYVPRQDFGLRVVWAGMEPAVGGMRKIFEEKYGLTTGDQYATADVGVIAFECSQKGGMHLHEDMVVEIVDPAVGKQLGPGEVGEVVVTPFDETFPLIRFGTGDLSSYIDEPCPCGRTSVKLTGVVGSAMEAVRAKGVFIYPRHITEVSSKFPEVSRCQAIVTRPQLMDYLSLKIELSDEAVDKEGLIDEVKKSFQEATRLKLGTVEFVPKGTIPEEARKVVDERKYG